jgi:hypothetical protein
MNHSAKKVVVFTTQPYSVEYEPLLLSLIDRKIELCCFAGVDSGNWETALDMLLVDPSRGFTHRIATTSHRDEPFEDVLNMAHLWFVEGGSEVEVLRI